MKIFLAVILLGLLTACTAEVRSYHLHIAGEQCANNEGVDSITAGAIFYDVVYIRCNNGARFHLNTHNTEITPIGQGR